MIETKIHIAQGMPAIKPERKQRLEAFAVFVSVLPWFNIDVLHKLYLNIFSELTEHKQWQTFKVRAITCGDLLQSPLVNRIDTNVFVFQAKVRVNLRQELEQKYPQIIPPIGKFLIAYAQDCYRHFLGARYREVFFLEGNLILDERQEIGQIANYLLWQIRQSADEKHKKAVISYYLKRVKHTLGHPLVPLLEGLEQVAENPAFIPERWLSLFYIESETSPSIPVALPESARRMLIDALLKNKRRVKLEIDRTPGALQITESQLGELLYLADKFYSDLETPHAPFPRRLTLAILKEKLWEVLAQQPGFENTLEEAKRVPQLYCISHKQTVVRNLPWQIAVADLSLLTIAKTIKPNLQDHEPRIGYPLKVLVMVSSPEGGFRLSYEEEELQLLRAFSPLMSQGLVQVHFTDDGSLENLEEKLRENKFHILHYSGHSSYKGGRGTLALEDPLSGRLREVSAVKFNEVLAKVSTKGHRPDLILLSGCQTAQGISAGDLSGIADTLLEAGLPAVIAMSAPILDTCATIFASKLYTELSNGLPLPDAFQEARMKVQKYELSLDLAQRDLAPGQWLIPQLLLNTVVAKLANEKTPKDTLDFKKDVKIIRGETTLVNLRVRPVNYVFVGRRKEKRIAMLQLKAGNSILLLGQGGVGKTALAEHLAIRLLAANQRIKVFTFSEKKPTGQSLLDQMQNYLAKDKMQISIVSELAFIQKLTDKFFKLLEKISEQCDPIFLFDNIESFQKFDAEKQIWVWHKEKHEDILQLMQILDKESPFPLIITGRYPIAEFPDLEICNMNTVPFGDFFRKCHQLGISELAQKLQAGTMPSSSLIRSEGDRPPTFEEVIRLLHKTFGGNYRALEFFDELYTQKGEEIFKTFHKLADFESKLAEKEIKEGVLSRMSENLIFEELLSYLNEEEKDSLLVLSRFNIPVLPMAVGMQRESTDLKKNLKKGVDLTLIESRTGINNQHLFYVTSLIRDLLKQKQETFNFNEKTAGQYHEYVLDNDLSKTPLNDYQEAFEHYFAGKADDLINKVGRTLSNYFYSVQQFRMSLSYGLRTEEIAKENTDGGILNILGNIFQIFGRLDQALEYYSASLEDDKKRNDLQSEGASLNNISQIHSVRGDYDQAIAYLEQSLKIRKEVGDRKGEGASLNNISQIHSVRGDYDQAIAYLEQSLKIQQEIGDRKGEGVTLNNISQIHSVRGDYDKAIAYLEQSLKIRQQIGDRKGEGESLNNLANNLYSRLEYDKALEYFLLALRISQEIGDRKGQGITLNNASQIFFIKGEDEQAMEYLKQSLEIHQEIGNLQGQASTLNNIGQIYFKREMYEKALELLEKALKIYQQIGDRKGEGSVLGNIGTIYSNTGESDKATTFLEQVLKIKQEIGDWHDKGAMLDNFSQMLDVRRGQDKTANIFWDQTLKIRLNQDTQGNASGDSILR